MSRPSSESGESDLAAVPPALRKALADRYRLRRKLGRGGMANVYLADDLRHPRAVAVKVLHPELADLVGARRFRDEIADLAGFAHPNIVQLIDSGTADEMLYYIMPYFPEGSLAERLAGGRQLAVEQAIGIARDVADALHHAHTRPRPLVHRDIKPQNIMLSGGRALVVDFGIARAVQTASSERLTPSGSNPGTPLYMSPEQTLSPTEVDGRADQYGLACVVYQMLSGQPPFTGDQIELLIHKHLTLEPRPLRALRPDAPSGIAQALERALAKRPADRFADIAEFARALGASAVTTAGDAPSTAQSGDAGSAESPDTATTRDMAPGATVDEHADTAPLATDRLPRYFTSFIGREVELWDCGQILNQARLLTLTGPGGCGKTRLAVRLAERRHHDFDGGIWFVDLAPVADPDRVIATVAATAGVSERPGKSLVDSLAARWSSGRTLLALDNCEHVVTAAESLARGLLEACPGLEILATSRAALHAPGERTYAVPPLGIPGADTPTTPEGLSKLDAIRLFVERARSIQREFALNDANAAAVAEICTRLDGIPLAIELAAARLRVLSVEEIRSRLRDRFKLLAGAAGMTIARQRTLEAACRWSYDLLQPDERRLFAALSVFAGGWTLESATAVCGEGADEFAMLDRLERLADQSLIVVEKREGAETRYRFLETLRRFADERLAESGPGKDFRRSHVEYFSNLATRVEKEFWGRDQVTWLKRAEIEHENLLAAIERAARQPDGLRIAQGMGFNLYRLWATRGWMQIGSRVLARLTEPETAGKKSAELARALFAAGGLATYEGRMVEARRFYQRSEQVAAEVGDQLSVGRAHVGLGVISTSEGKFDEAHDHYARSLETYNTLRYGAGLMMVHHNLGALELARHRYKEAIEHLSESLAWGRERGDRVNGAGATVHLGVARLRLKDLAGARADLLSGLRAARDLNSPRITAQGLEAVAELARTEADAESATRLLGAAHAMRTRFGLHESECEETIYTRESGSLRAVIGSARFDELWSSGLCDSMATGLGRAIDWLAGTEAHPGLPPDAATPA